MLGLVLLPLACSYDNPAYEAGQGESGPTGTGTGTGMNGAGPGAGPGGGPGAGPDSNGTLESTTESETTQTTETTGPEIMCGNGVVEPGELCLEYEDFEAILATPFLVATARIDPNDYYDVVVAHVGSDTVWYPGGPDGLITNTIFALGTSGVEPRDMALGDINGRGDPDYALAVGSNFDGILLDVDTENPLLLDPPGPEGNFPTRVALGDVMGDDGLADLLAVTIGDEDRLLAYPLGPQGPTGSLPTFDEEICNEPLGVEFADVDDNGRDDALVVCRGSDELVVVYSTPGGGLSHSAIDHFSTEGGAPESLAIADLDDDGDLDVVVTLQDSGEILALINEDDSDDFDTPFPPVPVGEGPTDLAIADFNLDEVPDVVVAVQGDGQPQLVVLVQDGDGDGNGFVLNHFPLPGPAWSVAAGDINGDTMPDVVTALPAPPLSAMAMLLSHP